MKHRVIKKIEELKDLGSEGPFHIYLFPEDISFYQHLSDHVDLVPTDDHEMVGMIGDGKMYLDLDKWEV
jgi:hypothetical protein